MDEREPLGRPHRSSGLMTLPVDLPRFDEVCRRLDERRARILAELHPDLRVRIDRILRDPRFAPWEGHRSDAKQRDAYARGASNAAPGQSPHNHLPALACDLVLDPRHVRVRPSKSNPEYPDLWDDESPDAQHAWQALDQMAAAAGLGRVRIRRRGAPRGVTVPDLPHVELPNWRDLAAR
ncbi:MAG: hypothetical protein VW405_01635 [Rhodospirillaceae bacterium]